MNSETTVCVITNGKVYHFRLSPKPGDLPLNMPYTNLRGQGQAGDIIYYTPTRIRMVGAFLFVLSLKLDRKESEKRKE